METGIVVSGTGEVSVAPDAVAVTMGVSVKRPDAPAAIAVAAAAATRLLDALSGRGVSEQDLRTSSYSIDQEFAYPDVGGPRPDGYRVANVVTAVVRDVGSVGAVLDAAASAGGADVVVQGVSFRLDDTTAASVASATARDRAFADARRKAEQYADLAGRALGDVVSIDEATTFLETMPKVFAARAVAGAATPIVAGDVDISVSVTVRWGFGDG